jgi:hypothetical protein
MGLGGALASLGLAGLGTPAQAQRTYTITTLEEAFDKAISLDPRQRAQGNRALLAQRARRADQPQRGVRGPQRQLVGKQRGHADRSQAFLPASPWATLQASDEGLWLALKDTNNRTFARLTALP